MKISATIFTLGLLLLCLSERDKDGWMRVYGPLLIGLSLGYFLGWLHVKVRGGALLILIGLLHLTFLTSNFAAPNPALLGSASETPAAGGGGGADVTENFEAPGYQTAFVNVSGSPLSSNSTAGLSLEANFCLYIDGNNNQEEAYVEFPASDTVYLFMMIRFEDLPSGSRRQWSLKNNTSTISDMAAGSGPTQWWIYDGVGSQNDLGSGASADTVYYIWHEYEKGTGANAQHRVYVSTTTTKPGTPDVEVTNGGSTSQVNRFYPGTWGAGGGNIYFDKLRISRTTAFGDNPS